MKVETVLKGATPVIVGGVALGLLLFYGGHLPIVKDASKGFRGDTNSGKFLGIF